MRECKSIEKWIKLCKLRKGIETVSKTGVSVPTNNGVFEKTIKVNDRVMKRYWIAIH